MNRQEPGRPKVARIVLVVIGLATAFGVYRWWNGPERQIRRVLEQLAETVNHETPVPGLQAVMRAARLRELTAPNVVATPGRPFGSIEGQDALMAAVARLIGATALLDVEFVDVKIALGPAGDTATVDLTAKTTVLDSGQETVDAREMMIEFAYLEGRWVMIRAQSIEALERLSRFRVPGSGFPVRVPGSGSGFQVPAFQVRGSGSGSKVTSRCESEPNPRT